MFSSGCQKSVQLIIIGMVWKSKLHISMTKFRTTMTTNVPFFIKNKSFWMWANTIMLQSFRLRNRCLIACFHFALGTDLLHWMVCLHPRSVPLLCSRLDNETLACGSSHALSHHRHALCKFHLFSRIFYQVDLHLPDPLTITELGQSDLFISWWLG